MKSRWKAESSLKTAQKLFLLSFRCTPHPKAGGNTQQRLRTPTKCPSPLEEFLRMPIRKNDPKSPWNLTHNVQGNFSDKKDWANKMLNHTGTIAERCRASFVTLWSWSGSRVWIPIREGWQTKPYCFISTHSNKYLWNKHSYSVQTLLHSTESYYRSHLGRETQLTKPSTQV